MTRIPDLWWSPSQGLFLRRQGALNYTPVLNEREQMLINRKNVADLPADVVALREDFGSDYIRVGEMVSTETGEDSYRLALGPQRMYLEPVDFGQPHVVELGTDGWTMKHPLTCRAQLFQCPVHKAALKSEPLSNRLGRFTCTVGYDGFLVIGEETA